MSEEVLALGGVVKRYPEGESEREILGGVDLSLVRGESVAVRGPSGAGKSTLLHVASGIDLPDAGEVRLMGRRLDALGDRERTLARRRHVGIVFQFFNLVPSLTALENVALPLELLGLAPARARTRALEWLDRLGVASRAGSWPARLSGGEQQRVAIARALVHEPAVVIADEPTGNLDERSGEAALAALAELPARLGSALLMVTHSRRVAGHCTRVMELARGRLHEGADSRPERRSGESASGAAGS